ncbi:PH domain-containing protein [Spelaeicoccus albus]|uniref:PH domain-containing protein n=1 Tax=Spelaeicoccus albus TaxID=1280376 RepID=UPI001F2B50A4|nr:PH domain-containing protein [Spelaeicoccus albus]
MPPIPDHDPAAGPAPEAGDPLSPPGLTWIGVSPALTKVRVITETISTGIPLLVCLVLALTVTAYLWIGVGVFAVLLVWLLWLIPRQVRAIGYAERHEDLLIKRGIMFRRLVVVPYGRMQYVDIAAGPIARKLGIADVKLHTASAATDASIPGLPAAEAARLREQLASRGEARLAGL